MSSAPELTLSDDMSQPKPMASSADYEIVDMDIIFPELQPTEVANDSNYETVDISGYVDSFMDDDVTEPKPAAASNDTNYEGNDISIADSFIDDDVEQNVAGDESKDATMNAVMGHLKAAVDVIHTFIDDFDVPNDAGLGQPGITQTSSTDLGPKQKNVASVSTSSNVNSIHWGPTSRYLLHDYM